MFQSSRLFFSNALLVLGVLFLSGFALLEINGLPIEPIVPALAAFCIAVTALLDRLDTSSFE